MGRQHLRATIWSSSRARQEARSGSPIEGRFKELLDDLPRDRLNFIVGERGLSLTAESFGNQFREWVKEAGLPVGLSAHGLRKAVCRRLAEAGCSANEIMAISGHRNHKEVANYTQATDAKRLAESAMATVSTFIPKYDTERPVADRIRGLTI